MWQSAPPRRETNNALKREPLELELGTLDGQSVDERLESPFSTSAEKHANVFNPVGACITFRMWSFLSGRDYSNQ